MKRLLVEVEPTSIYCSKERYMCVCPCLQCAKQTIVHNMYDLFSSDLKLCSGSDKQQSTPISPQPVLLKFGSSVPHKKETVMSDTELQMLKELLKQRNDEINVLLKMLKQERRRANEAESTLKDAGLAMEKKRPPSPILGRTSPLSVEGPVPDSMISMLSSTKSRPKRTTLESVTPVLLQDKSSSGMVVANWQCSTSVTATATAAGGAFHSDIADSCCSEDWSAVKAGNV